MQKIGIIGGGLGGLASACVLGARGYEVVVFERNEWLGGAKRLFSRPTGSASTWGPTILTLPAGPLDRIFAEAGRQVAGALNLVRLDPQWRSFFEDRSTLDLLADSNAMASRLSAFSPGTGTAEGYRRCVELSEQLHRISESYFFWRPVGGLRDMFDARATFQTSILRDVLAMRPGHSVAGTVRSRIPDSRVAQMVDHFYAICRLGAGRFTGRTLRYRAHADARRCMVPGGRNVRHSGGSDEPGRVSRRGISVWRRCRKDPHFAGHG